MQELAMPLEFFSELGRLCAICRWRGGQAQRGWIDARCTRRSAWIFPQSSLGPWASQHGYGSHERGIARDGRQPVKALGKLTANAVLIRLRTCALSF